MKVKVKKIEQMDGVKWRCKMCDNENPLNIQECNKCKRPCYVLEKEIIQKDRKFYWKCDCKRP